MGNTIISLEKKANHPFNFICKNERGGEIELTATENLGGIGNYFRPMENLLNSVAGCSAIDIVNILQKQRQEITDLKFKVEGVREPLGEANIFGVINITLSINKEVNETKLQKAIELTRDKYCSVLLSLRPDCKVNYSYEFI